MTLKSLSFVICRLFALYVLSQVFVYFVYLLNGSGLPPAFTAGDYSLFATVPPASIALALFFWFRAEWLAGKIVGRFADQEINTGLTTKDIQTAGFAVVGMYLLGDVLPSIASDVAWVIFGSSTDDYHLLPHHILFPRYIRLGGELIVSLLLVFKASYFSQKLQKPKP